MVLFGQLWITNKLSFGAFVAKTLPAIRWYTQLRKRD
jgi:hypothetical protein